MASASPSFDVSASTSPRNPAMAAASASRSASLPVDISARRLVVALAGREGVGLQGLHPPDDELVRLRREVSGRSMPRARVVYFSGGGEEVYIKAGNAFGLRR